MIRISPSILSADFSRLADEIRAAEDAGAHMLHIDVMDGRFVPNITIGPAVVESLRKVTKLPLDVHLMIAEPDRYLPDFISAGSDILTVHIEAATHLHRSVQSIKEKGVRAGVSLNPASPVALLEDIIDDLDMVLIMSVNPGFGGQDFIPHALVKIRQLRKLIDDRGLSAEIEVDGGVKPENVREVADAGASILVMGSAFFKSGDYRATMEKIRRALGNA